MTEVSLLGFIKNQELKIYPVFKTSMDHMFSALEKIYNKEIDKNKISSEKEDIYFKIKGEIYSYSLVFSNKIEILLPEEFQNNEIKKIIYDFTISNLRMTLLKYTKEFVQELLSISNIELSNKDEEIFFQNIASVLIMFQNLDKTIKVHHVDRYYIYKNFFNIDNSEGFFERDSKRRKSFSSYCSPCLKKIKEGELTKNSIIIDLD